MTKRSIYRRCFWRVMAFSIALCVLATCASAQDLTVQLDPAATTVEFTLGATMHTVHGAFKLKRGQIHFDPATGKASGEIVVDATSGDTDNSSRDKKMHEDILQSAKFPEIIFRPSGISGSVVRQGKSRVRLSGVFELHGAQHPANLDINVQSAADGTLHASTKFPVPYIQWGLKNPSTFLLHVSDTVDVQIESTGHLLVAKPGL